MRETTLIAPITSPARKAMAENNDMLMPTPITTQTLAMLKSKTWCHARPIGIVLIVGVDHSRRSGCCRTSLLKLGEQHRRMNVTFLILLQKSEIADRLMPESLPMEVDNFLPRKRIIYSKRTPGRRIFALPKRSTMIRLERPAFRISQWTDRL